MAADSGFRNLRSATTREERSFANDEAASVSGANIRQQLKQLEDDQQIDNESLDELSSELTEVEAIYQKERLQVLRLEQEWESQYREIEKARLRILNDRLPTHSDSARYILAQLLTGANCLACGNTVPEFKKELQARIDTNDCIVCGSHLTSEPIQDYSPSGDESIALDADELRRSEAILEDARDALRDTEATRDATLAEIQRLQSAITERTSTWDALTRRLPLEERQLHERRQELAGMRARVAVLEKEVNDMRDSFADVVTRANAAVVEHAMAVQNSFGQHAEEFLLENCKLIWSPDKAQLGQSGQYFDFPAFQLDLAGNNFNSPVRRSGPDYVSESQREFIDVSFRMALAEVAAQGNVTSLIMDAPESSLDAIFVRRAARVLGQFGRPDLGNRLVIASNLVDGQLIPELLKEAADKGDRAHRVVDLLDLAAPTAALNTFRCDYSKSKDALLRSAEIE